MKQLSPETASGPEQPTRRHFLAAAVSAGTLALPAAARAQPSGAGATAISFPHSYLYCTPRESGIWVRMQMECHGEIVDGTSGDSEEFALGIVAKTGLTPIPDSESVAPGYDYSLLFSKTHVYTKRSHASAAFNNPTVQRIEAFGEASWHCHPAPAEPLTGAGAIRAALQAGRSITARTEFVSEDGARKYRVEYPVKWADCATGGSHFRIETGPLVLLDPETYRTGSAPAFDAFQWIHVDYDGFEGVRCLKERPTSMLEDAAYEPARGRVGMAVDQVAAARHAVEGMAATGPAALNRKLFRTDHYADVDVRDATHQLFALGAPA